MSRILIHSVSPHVGSGYGMMSKALLELLPELGHEVVMQSSFGHMCYIENYHDTKIYPVKAPQAYGMDQLPFTAYVEKPDVYLSTFDLFIHKEKSIMPLKELGIPICSWLMIDSSPYQSLNLKPLSLVDYPIYTCNWATKQVPKLKEFVNHIPYVMSLPLDKCYEKLIDKKDAREAFNKKIGNILNDDSFLVMVNSNNSGDEVGRKNIPAMIRGWHKFIKETGCKNKYLYLHMDIKGEMGKGVDIKKTLAFDEYNKEELETIIFCNQFLYQTGQYNTFDLRDFYNASDLYLNASDSEGFGMPICESMLCGIPALVTNFGPSAEIVMNCNPDKKYLMDGWDKYVGFQSYRKSVDYHTIAEHLFHIYKNPMNKEERKEMRQKCIDLYGWNTFKSRLNDFLKVVKSNIGTKGEW